MKIDAIAELRQCLSGRFLVSMIMKQVKMKTMVMQSLTTMFHVRNGISLQSSVRKKNRRRSVHFVQLISPGVYEKIMDGRVGELFSTSFEEPRMKRTIQTKSTQKPWRTKNDF